MTFTLITGGAGFIGAALARNLVADGRRVRVFDNFDPRYDPDRKWRRLSPLVRQGTIELEVGDVRDRAALDRAMRGVEAVVHLAEAASVRDTQVLPDRHLEVNAVGGLRVLEAAAAAGADHVVLGSSAAVYGGALLTPRNELETLATPSSAYAAAKRALETTAEWFALSHEVRVTTLRLFSVYGPDQPPDLMIARTLIALRSDRDVSVFGAGGQRRCYTAIADVVAGIRRALDRGGERFRVFNIARAESHAVSEVVQALATVVGKTAKLVVAESPAREPGCLIADVGRAERELGFVASIPLAEGLAAMVASLPALPALPALL